LFPKITWFSSIPPEDVNVKLNYIEELKLKILKNKIYTSSLEAALRTVMGDRYKQVNHTNN
jgi:hypothetical protein